MIWIINNQSEFVLEFWLFCPWILPWVKEWCCPWTIQGFKAFVTCLQVSFLLPKLLSIFLWASDDQFVLDGLSLLIHYIVNICTFSAMILLRRIFSNLSSITAHINIYKYIKKSFVICRYHTIAAGCKLRSHGIVRVLNFNFKQPYHSKEADSKKSK